MAKYDPDTGERVVPSSRRPSFLMIVLFIVLVGGIVWVLVPKNHASISFSAVPQSQNVDLPKSPPGSVSGVSGVPSSDTAQSTVEKPVTSPDDSNASPVHPAPSPNPGP